MGHNILDFLFHKKNKILLYFIFVPILAAHNGCDKKAEVSDNEPPKINFTINPNLLGSKITNVTEAFEFNPPYFLTAVQPDSLNIFTQKFQTINDDSLNISLLYLFSDSSGNNSLSISRIVFPKDSTFGLLDEYSKRLRKGKLFAKANVATFFKGNLLMSQFIINYEEHVLIKVMIEGKNDNIIQFDYVLSLNDYKNEVRSIESSIGSINNLYQ